MIACVHQPNFLPWLGFFSKIASSDVYIVMDNAQFPRNSWVNRVRIGGRGDPMWLTVPVRHLGELEVTIAETEISYESDWVHKHVRTLQQRYARAPHFKTAFAAIEEPMMSREPLLAERNLDLIRAVLGLCGIERRIVRGSELAVSGSSSNLIAQMCTAVGADVYLAGQGGAGYDDLGVYDDARIEYRSTSFSHPQYEQATHDDFEQGLSIIDVLFNVGVERTRELLAAGSRSGGTGEG